MRTFRTLLIGALLLGLAACDAPPKTTPALSPTPAPAKPAAITTPAAGATVTGANPTPGSVTSQASGWTVASDGNKLRVSGHSPLQLSLKQLANAPALPPGWVTMAPVFEVTAADAERRPIRALKELLRLRFDVRVDRPLSVLVGTDAGWQVVPSEVDADGSVVADIDHLTPYTVAAPVTNRTVVAMPATTPSPRATVTVATVTPKDATATLQGAIKPIKNKTVTVTGASGYTGTLAIAVPSTLQSTLNSAISAGGSATTGLYSVVNEAVTVQASGGSAAGAFTLLAEPRTALPATAADAQPQLAALFPGIPTDVQPIKGSWSGYLFAAHNDTSAYAVGYTVVNQLPMAYAIVGTGRYQSLIPAN